MLVRQLEYFVAVAHEQHFARAAEACHVSQPALSDGLRRLETELGVPLIRRRHSFEGLTPEGERVVVWARRILADYKALAAEVEILRGGLSGQLRIGVVPSASTTVAPLLEQFSAAHPLVHTSVNTKLSTQEIVRRLAAFELDIALCYPFEEVKGLRQQGFYEETWVLLASESMLDEVPESMTWREAGTFPWHPLTPPCMGWRPWIRPLNRPALIRTSASTQTRWPPSSPWSTREGGRVSYPIDGSPRPGLPPTWLLSSSPSRRYALRSSWLTTTPHR